MGEYCIRPMLDLVDRTCSGESGIGIVSLKGGGQDMKLDMKLGVHVETGDSCSVERDSCPWC